MAMAGITIPHPDFKPVIKWRGGVDGAGLPLGTPWLSWSCLCPVCGRATKGIDRRAKLGDWLLRHGPNSDCNNAWTLHGHRLLAEDFSFRTPTDSRELAIVLGLSKNGARADRRAGARGGGKRARDGTPDIDDWEDDEEAAIVARGRMRRRGARGGGRADPPLGRDDGGVLLSDIRATVDVAALEEEVAAEAAAEEERARREAEAAAEREREGPGPGGPGGAGPEGRGGGGMGLFGSFAALAELAAQEFDSRQATPAASEGVDGVPGAGAKRAASPGGAPSGGADSAGARGPSAEATAVANGAAAAPPGAPDAAGPAGAGHGALLGAWKREEDDAETSMAAAIEILAAGRADRGRGAAAALHESELSELSVRPVGCARCRHNDNGCRRCLQTILRACRRLGLPAPARVCELASRFFDDLDEASRDTRRGGGGGRREAPAAPEEARGGGGPPGPAAAAAWPPPALAHVPGAGVELGASAAKHDFVSAGLAAFEAGRRSGFVGLGRD